MSSVDDAVDRLKQAIDEEIRMTVRDGVERLSSLCESPIETLFLASFVFADAWGRFISGEQVRLAVLAPEQSPGKAGIELAPQYPWQGYRIDFAWFARGELQFFVECDGHNFHERTPAQAERDRSKDRAIQQAGIPILRFTGREIWRDPFGCVMQCLSFPMKFKPK
ncbi:endonuclease domain-containing protein [Pseudorhodoplanes sinuspersici]|uniref:Restriction endonuclease type II-like domain-containing protein n=1 Tax=Pseudorhodoplanes sinuspersici TaxID=1235591 RepID=A0A1W6ZWW5_9HYPH|nr:DUF559 domain-containing protein [Pseudorhodoplanes sinuspersici]ARQ01899.1 hypothetical protein CAK95_24470 [Pseudorhodoplanes sinuspersici]RKE73665.1 uncharacterized protein DUF559 [Pseudorhodoplanes sinuspersici]